MYIHCLIGYVLRRRDLSAIKHFWSFGVFEKNQKIPVFAVIKNTSPFSICYRHIIRPIYDSGARVLSDCGSLSITA